MKANRMQNFIIDCTRIKTEADFWRQYLLTVQPEGTEFFGRNLDAFWDALSGGGPGWPGQSSVFFINTETLKDIDNGYFYRQLKKIERDLQELYSSSETKITVE
jgi:Barstar (barnase inhibitor)